MLETEQIYGQTEKNKEQKNEQNGKEKNIT